MVLRRHEADCRHANRHHQQQPPPKIRSALYALDAEAERIGGATGLIRRLAVALAARERSEQEWE